MFDEIERHIAGTLQPEAYPGGLERRVALKNGESLRIRPIRPDDGPLLVELYNRLSRHTAYQRFFTVMRRLPPDWVHYFANVDYRRRLALVAERETVAGVELVGVGRYEPSEDEATGEVAFVLEDGYQGRGLGAVLLDAVVQAGIGARPHAIPRVRARREPPHAEPAGAPHAHHREQDRAGRDHRPVRAPLTSRAGADRPRPLDDGRRPVSLHARLGEARSALRQETLPHVVPPRYGDARDVKRQEDLEREVGPAGGFDRGAETPRDEVAAASADR